MSSNHPRRSVPLTAVACALLLGTAANASDPWTQYTPAKTSYRVSLGGGSSGDGWTRCVAGDFDNDKVRDVAQILVTSAGASGRIFFAPSTFQAPLVFPTSGLRDIDVFRDGGVDQLLVLDDNGLQKGVYNYNSSGSPQHTIPLTTAISSTYNWGSALLVRNATPSDATTTRLVGVAANGTDLLIGTSGNGWVPTVVSAGATIREIALIQWDGTGDLEIALATASGPRIYSADGNPLDTFPSYPIESRICVVRQTYGTPSAPPDRLAVVLTTSSPYSQVVGIAKKGTTNLHVLEESINLGDLNASVVVGGDMDDDGDDDLYFSNRMACVAFVLNNARTPSNPAITSFTSSNVGVVDLLDQYSSTTAAPNNVATPVLTDLDNDGDDDFFMGIPPAAIGNSRDVRVVLGSGFPQNSWRPDITSLFWDDSPASFVFAIDHSQVPPNATHLELDAWYGAGSYSSTSYSLQNTELSGAPAAVTLASTPTSDYSLTVPYPNPTTLASIGVRLRFVKRHATTGALEAAYPALVGLLTNDNTEVAYIQGLADSGSTVEGIPLTDLPETVGGFVPRPKIGPYAGVVPKVN